MHLQGRSVGAVDHHRISLIAEGQRRLRLIGWCVENACELKADLGDLANF